MSIRKNKAVVLLSGGLDSAVCLWWAKKRGWDCHALSFDYGQRHNKELKSAKKLARLTNVPLHVVRFALPWSGSSLTNAQEKLPHHQTLKKITTTHLPSTYVPARNTIFLSFALSWADQINASKIVIGANAVDYSGYPDCRPKYIQSFESVANLGSRLGTEKKIKIKIVAPLLKLSKADIIRLGVKLKMPIEKTWSCYKGDKKPCGLCDSCLFRNKGLQEAGLL
ncbi:MAG: 7-cyano-7-deazaguanine synthase QueC [Elusimicrobiota bacterium]